MQHAGSIYTLRLLLHGLVPALWLRLCIPVLQVQPVLRPYLITQCMKVSDCYLFLIVVSMSTKSGPLRMPVLDLVPWLPHETAKSATQATNGSWSEAATEPLQAMVVWQPAAGWSPVQGAIRGQRGLTSPAPVTVSTAACLAGQARRRSFALHSNRRRTRSLLCRAS